MKPPPPPPSYPSPAITPSDVNRPLPTPANFGPIPCVPIAPLPSGKKRQSRAKQSTPPQYPSFIPPPAPQLHLGQIPGDRRSLFDQLFREPNQDLFQFSQQVAHDFSLQNSATFEYYNHPPIPIVFRPFTNGRQPTYHPLSPGQPTVINFDAASSDRRPDLFFVATFLQPYQSRFIPSCSLIMDDAEVPARRFGEKTDSFFLIGPGNELPARQIRLLAKIEFPRVENQQPEPVCRSWFVIQALERKPMIELLREICEREGYVRLTELPKYIEVQTPQCRTCKFNGLTIIERAQNFQDPFCPNCFKPVIVSELVWLDLMFKGTEDEEPAEVRAAKTKFFEYYASSVCGPIVDRDWEKGVFGEVEGMDFVPQELEYTTAEDPVTAYIQEMMKLSE